MPNGVDIPDLTFPTLEFGKKETPWNLNVLLYKGGAKGNKRVVSNLIAEGKLGEPCLDRLPLVKALHASINGILVGGGSRHTAANQVRRLREFFAWADETSQALTLEHVQTTFLRWTDSLGDRLRFAKDLSEWSAYHFAADTSSLLDRVLERQTPLTQLSRLRAPSQRKTARGIKAEKQNLQDTFTFGHMLQDICDALTIEVVLRGALPVRILLRTGAELEQRSGLPSSYYKEASDTYQAEGTLKTRYPLANLRIEAELLMFIGQTGMNLEQAYLLRLRNFSYAPYLDGYQVKERKARRGGAVLFEVFRDYKPHFERYLAWRRKLFPDSDLIFPFVRRSGTRQEVRFTGQRLGKICKQLDMPYLCPRLLRNTRINWLLRESANPDITAELAQHTKETLLNVYERPSQQRAMVEVMRFWAKNDPELLRTTPVAPGFCNGLPKAMSDMPKEATKPDCIRPSGCLWCEHHRDIDSQDYVWSLTSFGQLKSIELSMRRGVLSDKTIPSAQHSIDRITAKLRCLEKSNACRRNWVQEAQARIEEGNFHPDWAALINSLEAAS